MLHVKRGSIAEKIGIIKNDVIISIFNRIVEDLEDLEWMSYEYTEKKDKLPMIAVVSRVGH